ncbi:recombinase family protein (plasmid) [Morganella morganii]|uniref:recombinase family protein n=1 Tax=Morganella morganii TaxID=582 RepID=UPI0028D85D9E|nr:recombinase family protein [Morganella morganii]WNP32602.1 recombinase family protein [Morganella morganii]
MAIIGYIRVSKTDKNSELQRNALISMNCDLVFEDGMSGKTTVRPGLKRVLKVIKAGDTLVVWKLSRLGHCTKNLIALLSELHKRGAHFRSLTDNINTCTPGCFFFHVISVLAETERELNAERMLAGWITDTKDSVGGRPAVLSLNDRDRIDRLLEKGYSRQQMAMIYGGSISTIYRYFPVNELS